MLVPQTYVYVSSTCRQDIVRAGEHLDQMARTIAHRCPDERCKRDLLAYLERTQLCCHQLKITSAVKSDQTTSLEEMVSVYNISARRTWLHRLSYLVTEDPSCALAHLTVTHLSPPPPSLHACTGRQCQCPDHLGQEPDERCGADSQICLHSLHCCEPSVCVYI